MPTLDECFLAVKWQKIRYISMTTWPGHAFSVSFVYIPLRKTLSPLYLLRKVCIRSPANDLKLKMVTGYLNESSDPYLDNFQSNLIFTTWALKSFVSIRCIFMETDHPPSFFSCFFFTYFRWPSPLCTWAVVVPEREFHSGTKFRTGINGKREKTTLFGVKSVCRWTATGSTRVMFAILNCTFILSSFIVHFSIWNSRKSYNP